MLLLLGVTVATAYINVAAAMCTSAVTVSNYCNCICISAAICKTVATMQMLLLLYVLCNYTVQLNSNLMLACNETRDDTRESRAFYKITCFLCYFPRVVTL